MLIARAQFDRLSRSLEVAERKLAEKDAAILKLQALVTEQREANPDSPVPVQPATGDARLRHQLALSERARRHLDQTSRDLHWTTVIQEREITQLRDDNVALRAALEEKAVAS